jgi:two-component system chemotaxis response regulator CheY
MSEIFTRANKELRKKIGNLSVLVIDDQAEIRSLLCEILKDAGIPHVFEAGDAKAALNLIDDDLGMINFILCDWNMPGMKGIDFLRHVRTAYPDMPFLMITSRGDKNSVIDAKAAGVSAYIRKPFSPKQLEEKIEALLS